MTYIRSATPEETTVSLAPHLSGETARNVDGETVRENDGTAFRTDLTVDGAAQSSEKEDSAGTAPPGRLRHVEWKHVTVFGLLPAVVMVATLGVGYLKWQNATHGTPQDAAQSVQAATETAVAMLSYAPDTAQKDLGAAQDRLTGAFRDSYSDLVNKVVIPGAKQQRVSAEATSPAAASVLATDDHAVVLVFINQTTTIGQDPPTNTASSVRMSLDKVQGRWLVSGFDPV
jgi:Mce-associated membrane protein